MVVVVVGGGGGGGGREWVANVYCIDCIVCALVSSNLIGRWGIQKYIKYDYGIWNINLADIQCLIYLMTN